VLIQKYIAIGREKEGTDSEEQHTDIAHMVRTKDHSEVDLISNAESDTDKENEGYLETSYSLLQMFFLGSARHQE
jgi:hypothetical protein